MQIPDLLFVTKEKYLSDYVLIFSCSKKISFLSSTEVLNEEFWSRIPTCKWTFFNFIFPRHKFCYSDNQLVRLLKIKNENQTNLFVVWWFDDIEKLFHFIFTPTWVNEVHLQLINFRHEISNKVDESFTFSSSWFVEKWIKPKLVWRQLFVQLFDELLVLEFRHF